MGLFTNYENAGRGVPKAPNEKKGFFKFWEVFFRHIWDLACVNLLYIVFLIPFFILASFGYALTGSDYALLIALGAVVVFGPATAGLVKVTRNFSQERSAFIVHDFWSTFKRCFKRAAIVGIADFVLLVAFVVGAQIYAQLGRTMSVFYILLAIFISMMLIIVMMHYYIYLLIVSTNLKMKQIIKNSFLLTSIGLKGSICTFFSILGMCLFFVMLVFVLPDRLAIYIAMGFIVGWLFAFYWFTAAFNCYPTIRKYVIQPYYDDKGEDNPEFDYLKPIDDNEAIFKDKGGTEAPVVIKKNTAKSRKNKGKKGGRKRIS